MEETPREYASTVIMDKHAKCSSEKVEVPDYVFFLSQSVLFTREDQRYKPTDRQRIKWSKYEAEKALRQIYVTKVKKSIVQCEANIHLA